MAAVGLDEIDEGERNVLGVVGQRQRGNGTRILRSFRFADVRRHVAQDRRAPFGDHFFGDLVHGRQYTADTARNGVVGHGAVGDGEVGLFAEAVTVQLELDVFVPSGGAGGGRGVGQRPG